jgi:hypothetical protein
MSHETPRVLLVGGELMARSRIDEAARAAGMELVTAATLPEASDFDSYELVVLDLDSGGRAAVEKWSEAGPTTRSVAYVSHVDEDLMGLATAAGIETYPRGRFWRTLPEIISAQSP